MDTNLTSIPNCTVSHPKRSYNHCCENLKFHLKVYKTILVLCQICGTHSAIEDSDFWEMMLCISCMVLKG